MMRYSETQRGRELLQGIARPVRAPSRTVAEAFQKDMRTAGRCHPVVVVYVEGNAKSRRGQEYP